MEYHFQNYVRSARIRGHMKMGGTDSRGNQIEVTSQYLTKAGKPWIGVMGEYHFSRDSRENWLRELYKMKAGGICAVSTYVFWICHEEEEGVFDFSGNNDIRTFFHCAQEAGLEICLRLGPWVNGECRNGGFPDWLMQKDCQRRSNDPVYLRFVERYWKRLYEEVKDIPLLMIQLENELVDSPEHMAQLKKLALSVGYRAPVYTATGWNGSGGAKLPLDEVLPVFGGYPEAPWERHREKLPPSTHFFFNRMRNDADIGADLMVRPSPDGWQLPYERYPFATCELGGGVQIGHHRRPIIRPMDIYALSLVELGCGNNWIGYYMYHGGTNATGRHSTLNADYCPVRNYDFQAPVSQYGEIREHYRLLNLLNLFAADFGSVLAPMEMVEARHTVARDDTESLRCCMRTDGEGGFIFVNHYQRLDQLKDLQNVVFHTGSVVFPPIDVRGEICFFMPFNLKMGQSFLEYATAQPLCTVGNTFFFVAIPGIKPVFKFRGEPPRTVSPGLEPVSVEAGAAIVTLTWEQALGTRKLGGKLVIGEDEDLYETGDGILAASGHPAFPYHIWQGDKFVLRSHKAQENAFAPAARLTREPCAQPFELPEAYAQYLRMGHPRKVTWQRLQVGCPYGFVEIGDVFDVGQLYVDGQLAADQFYYGLPWRLPASMLYGHTCYLAQSQFEDDFYREFELHEGHDT